jgi:hypothetical protein
MFNDNGLSRGRILCSINRELLFSFVFRRRLVVETRLTEIRYGSNGQYFG